MSEITDKLIFELIKHHYRPYDTHEEFGRGFSACQSGNSRNPHEADSISAQAWRRGVEAAIHYKKATTG
jgi:hypothetical protein